MQSLGKKGSIGKKERGRCCLLTNAVFKKSVSQSVGAAIGKIAIPYPLNGIKNIANFFNVKNFTCYPT
jgi:hypothetical protein